MMTNMHNTPAHHAHSGYLVEGRGSPLVLLHSSMSSKAQWDSLIELLAERHRIIAIDLYGYGDVPMPLNAGAHTLMTEVTRVRAILQRELGPGEPFHLAGHSFGGAVALRLAHLEPSRVRSLALFEPTAFHLLPEDSDAMAAVRTVAQQVKEGLADGSTLAAAGSFIDFWNGPGAFAAYPAARQAQFAAQLRKVDLDFDALINDACTARDYANINCPILLLLGRSSLACTRDIAAHLVGHLPDCLIGETSGGHMAPVTHRTSVNLKIAGFLNLIDNNASYIRVHTAQVNEVHPRSVAQHMGAELARRAREGNANWRARILAG